MHVYKCQFGVDCGQLFRSWAGSIFVPVHMSVNVQRPLRSTGAVLVGFKATGTHSKGTLYYLCRALSVLPMSLEGLVLIYRYKNLNLFLVSSEQKVSSLMVLFCRRTHTLQLPA